MPYKRFETDLFGRKLKVEIGQVATQANGAVLLTYGETMVLATCTMSKEPKEVDYLPLTVDYEEKLYAAGKIKGSRFIKREGRPSEEAILTGRMIDRIIRPRFDQRIRNEIQVVITVLSFDEENDPDIPALLAASIALSISDIPWKGPLACLRIGRSLEKKTEGVEPWILNPTYQAREESDFELVVAGTEERINMLEGDAKEVPEEVLLSAIEIAQKQIKPILKFQENIIEEIKPVKVELILEERDPQLTEKVRNWLGDRLEKALYQTSKTERQKELEELEKELITSLIQETEPELQQKKEKQIREIFEYLIDELVHQNILQTEPGAEKRPDGRKLDEVRPIKIKVSFLPRTHGSALFQRGETQSLSVVTLGAPGEEQWIEGMETEAKKYFMHHYNFPPFCTGETGRLGAPGRREIGHGALAERALLPLIPDKKDFPYIIRAVSEILSSNGSSSMAAVSGSSLALMDAGVPLKRNVSGVAMGLMMESPEKYKILTDIQGPEDHHGDMDCKIAGTVKGVTAIQMDVKIEGVTLEILKKTFRQAKDARHYILKEMDKVLVEPRPQLSPLAPRVTTLKIDPNKIGEVIGPGGRVINEIINKTGAKIEIEDDGLVNIASDNEESVQKALEWVKNLTREIKPGEIFQGKVTKITDFGAFVEILPNQEGLVHISEMASYRVKRVEDIVKVGEIIWVKVKNIDQLGRINLTMKNVDLKH